MKYILPGLYTFTGLLMGWVYAIEDTDGLTIIDAGLDSAAGKVVKQLEAAGRKASDVKRILITHGYPDHVGGLPRLKAATRARVLTLAEDRAAIEGREPIERVPVQATRGAIWPTGSLTDACYFVVMWLCVCPGYARPLARLQLTWPRTTARSSGWWTWSQPLCASGMGNP
jgi:glyoxylase-like metal-dependent hydrolase (beta-lactamase superfamily II)